MEGVSASPLGRHEQGQENKARKANPSTTHVRNPDMVDGYLQALPQRLVCQ